MISAVPWQNIEGFAGAAGIGALCFLGIFLFLDGRAPDLFPTVEFFAKTTTWSIVAVVPVLAISYIIGLVTINSASIVIDQIPINQARYQTSDLIVISEHDNSAITQEYAQLRHDKDLLGGAFLALVLLSIGALSEIRNLPNLRGVIVIAATGVLLLAFITLGLAFFKVNAAHDLVAAVRALP